jgi:hypothetical protein
MASVLGAFRGFSEFTGILITGLLAGAFSVLALVIAKENRLSELRQAWIDSLRSDLGSFVAYATLIQAYISMFPRKDSDESDSEQLKRFWDENHDSYLELNKASTQIKLRLNPADPEPEAAQLLSEMQSLEGLFSRIQSSTVEAVAALTARIENLAQPLLKKEWERVKRGEKWYRRSRLLAFLLSGVFLLMLIVAIGSKFSPFQEVSPNSAEPKMTAPCPSNLGIAPK